MSTSHPTSYAQRRMWFLQMLDPASPVYNIPCGLRRQGPLEIPALRRALDEIVRRHKSLRTTFRVEDGEPVQVVAPRRRQAVEVVDLRPFPEGQRNAEVQRLAFKEAMTPFDLERGPLLRAMVLVVGDEDRFLLFTMHHIVSDGWSVRLFFQELETLLEAYGAGAASPLPELPTQYAEYARWQKERLSGPVLESLLTYWRERLADAPAVIELPVDRPRPKVQRFVGATLPVVIEEPLRQELLGLAQRNGATLFMVLLTGLAVVLHRYSGQTDIVLGTPVALREKPELESLIGLFVNTLVLRLDLGGRPSVEELLRRVVDVTVDAYSNQELPFERLVEELQPDRSLSHQPIVQSVFTLLSAMTQARPAQPAPAPEAEAPAQPPSPVPSTAKFDLTLSLAESENGLWGGVEYNVDLFDAQTVAHLIERLRLVLAGMAADPSRPVADLPLLNDAERFWILAGCNPTARLLDSPATVVQRIWEAAEARPDDVAVIVDRGDAVTYRELTGRAGAVAARLRAQGIGRGSLVPVCLHRSADLMAGLLGIVRAGAAYVPLDPDHPRARIEAMVRDIGAAVALTSDELADRLPADVERLSVSGISGGSGEPRGDLPFPDLDDLAYAIFTSGSTGKPKCAANPHGSLLNRLLWMQAAFPLGPGDRVLQKTPYTFDVSVWELFWPLMAGSTVVFAVPGEHGDPAYLAEAITAQRITTLHFVPSMLRTFLEHPHSRRCTSLRRVIASGEALPPDVASMFHSRLNAELHNLYGPTECAIDVTHWPCRRGGSPQVVPIGYPIWNVRTHVLDPESLEPVPLGAKGELFIAGTGVGRGYIGQPGLTAERFLPDPFAAEPGSRMYRTGDLARYRTDLSIEYLGRIDHQLKVRGFRIEAGEVERALCGHPAILEAVATVRSAGSADQRLVAHCVPDPEAGCVVRSLLRYEREGLLDDELMVEEMANGLSVIARNRGETQFLYDEIFVDQEYLRHGIDLSPGSVVFDVGANVGMFALYVGLRCEGARVYAFEPIPEVHKLLAMNAGLYPWRIETRRVALGREPGAASFTYYPQVSILSGRYADYEAERDVILAFEANRGYAGPELEKLVGDRLQAEVVQCEIRTVSQVLAEEGLDRIDLLKIDVEKSEQDVLAGIAEGDWPKIRQVAVEVHEIDSRVSQVCDLLHRHGFEVTVDQEALLRGSAVSMVFGRRGPRAEAGAASGEDMAARLPASPGRLRDQVRQSVAAKLPDYMVPSELIWLERMPRLSSGKIDRKSLPGGSSWVHQAARTQRSVAPRTATETRIAQIFSEVLGCGAVGLYERFFDLGGHSLLATSAIARLRDAFGVEVSLRDFFEDPTVSGLARCVESGDARSSDLAETIPRTIRGPEDLAPLSFTQQRLWFLDRFSPGDASYNIPVILPLPFHVDAALLERSLSEVARRHEILRTTFPFVDGQPAQRIASDPTLRLQAMDVSSLDPAAIPNEIYGLVLREIRRPFDLANGPIIRALLIYAGPGQQTLVLTMHHIAADGWSMSILYRELATIYDAFSKGLPSPLPELPVQFADFAAWQRKWLTGEALERQQEYWLSCLADAPKLLELPSDYPRPPVQSTRGDIHLFEIEPAIYGDLATLARQESCTTFMAFLAAFDVLFHRLCGVRDVRVGSPIANRRRPELEGLIGFFSNTIIFRTKWEGDPSFRSLLQTVRDVTLGAFAHQDMPFEYLVSELEAERALDRTPLFQVMLIFQNLEGWDSSGLVEAPPVATGTSKFDLSLYLLPSGAGLTGQLEFCIDLFTHETVACMMRHYRELLAQAAANPDAPISTLLLLPEEPPPAPAEPAAVETLPERIAALAGSAPGAPAVRCGAEEVAWKELADRADRLASRLAGAGVRTGERVAVAIGPSLELIVSLLAVARLGAASLVLHPEDPEARIAGLGAGSRLLLFAGDRPAVPGELEAMDVREASAPAESLPPMPSGGAQRALAWRLRHSPLAALAGRRVACASEPSENGAALHLAALYHGSCLILPERAPAVSTRTFSRTLRSASAEALVVRPRILSVLAREFARSLDGVEIAVELADPEEIQQLRSALPHQVYDGCRWMLGIAGLGFVTVAPAAAGDVALDEAAGEPVRVVDESLRPAPLGAFGELVFTGPDPEAPPVRTGVRALRTASGAVKLRAAGELLRVAWADVESALRRCAGVGDALVAFDEPLAEPAAFVIQEPRTSAALIAGELRAWLRPERIPKTIRFVSRFPLRSNGRIDLPALARQARDGSDQYTAPRTELEHGIARLWTETLGLDRVSVHDDFFVLGGHSLLATAFIARLNLAFGVELPLRALFEHPTIETLAQVIAGLVEEGSGAPVLPIERSADAGPAPLSFAQQRLWFLDRYEPGSPLYNIVGALPLRLRLSTEALERAVNAVVQRHESLRLRFDVVDWEPVQRVEDGVRVPVPLFDLSGFDPDRREAETARLTGEIAREAFDLEKAPLLRLRLIRREDDDYLLLLSIHHIVADGWSLEIFTRELSFFYALFAAGAAGETAGLPELPIQYTDYARWQRSWFAGEVLQRHISYWRRLLGGAPPLLRLPEDYPRPPAQIFEGQIHHAAFGGGLAARLREVSRAEGATTFMTLLAAYVALLGRYTGSADVVVGTPFSNRRRPELAGMIGFVANTMALRFDLSGPVSFRELVGRVRAVVLESYEYQETPFEKIVEELQLDRDASFNPLFQLAFTHRTSAERPEGDLDSAAVSPRTGTSKFDFSLSLWETPHEILCEAEFRVALYSPETVGHFVANYERLLRAVLEDLDRPVAGFDLLLPEERAFALAAPVRPAVEAAAHDALAEIAGRHPGRVAIRTSRTELSLEELLSRSERCAAALQAAGVGPGDAVGVYVPDAAGELIALLGVARAGGVCVPLSRFEPAPRLRVRLAETEAKALVTAGAAGLNFPEVFHVVAVDDLPEEPLEPVRVDLDAPLLIGEEGFRVSHREFAASVRAEILEASLAEGESTLIAGLGAPGVLHDAMAVWLSGGTAVLPDLRELGDPKALRELAVRAYGPVWAFCEPGEPEPGEPGRPETLREIVIDYAPEIPAEAVQRLQARVFERLVGPDGLPALQRWPFGRSGNPKSRARRSGLAARILDHDLNGVPVGVPGDVCLADGERPRALGVSGRWLDDGSIQVLGRSDGRLRVRGYDVDRDLIESVLRSVPGVREAAVTVQRDELTAFLQGSYIEAEARARLNRHVPAFMIPAAIVRVTQLPRAWSGEVDRRILRPDREEGTAPRTDLEQLVAATFSDVLGWDAVGVHDGLLALGGHCREAVRIAAALSEALGMSVEPADVFLHSTPEALAIVLTQRSLTGEEDAERLLAELESLDDSEVQALLSEGDAPFLRLP